MPLRLLVAAAVLVGCSQRPESTPARAGSSSPSTSSQAVSASSSPPTTTANDGPSSWLSLPSKQTEVKITVAAPGDHAVTLSVPERFSRDDAFGDPPTTAFNLATPDASVSVRLVVAGAIRAPDMEETIRRSSGLAAVVSKSSTPEGFAIAWADQDGVSVDVRRKAGEGSATCFAQVVGPGLDPRQQFIDWLLKMCESMRVK